MFQFTNKTKEADALKQELDTYRPLKPEVAKQLKEYYKIGLTYTSNAIEGNSLTESETKVVIEDGLTIGGKPLKDHLEALGHAQAYDFLFEIVQKTKEISEADILKFHHFLFPSPEQVPVLMKEFASQIPNQKKNTHPIEFAAWLHCRLVDIHPFVDGKGRVARLLMNLALL